MEQLLLVGVWHRACQTAAEVLGLSLFFEVREEHESVWASFSFALGTNPKKWYFAGHEVSLVMYKDGSEHHCWTDGAEQIDERCDPAPWKATTIAEIIVALGDAPRGTVTEADWRSLDKAYRHFQGEVTAPLKAPKQLREGLRQIEHDAIRADIRRVSAAEFERTGYYAGPALG